MSSMIYILLTSGVGDVEILRQPDGSLLIEVKFELQSQILQNWVTNPPPRHVAKCDKLNSVTGTVVIPEEIEWGHTI